MDLGLRAKVAFVTGGARGIGWGIVEALAAEGAALVIADKGNFDRAQERATTLNAQGVQAMAVEGDVGSLSDVERMVGLAIERFQHIDILVNNAGTLSRKPILDDAIEDWEGVLRTNLFGCFYCSRVIAPAMIERGWGRIVNISSIHGRVAKAGMGAYCTSKAAIDMFTKQLAVELAAHGVTVNAVAPGTISTEINIPLYKSTRPEDVALREATLKRVPAGRIGDPSGYRPRRGLPGLRCGAIHDRNRRLCGRRLYGRRNSADVNRKHMKRTQGGTS